MTSLTLDRRLGNSSFESWKIGSDFVAGKCTLQLPQQVFFGAAADACDFQHTRASVLQNHLLESLGRLFIATASKEGPLHIYELAGAPGGAAATAPPAPVPRLLQIAVLPPLPADPAAGAAVEAALHCSLAVVAPNAGDTAAAADLLVSRGQGDLVLVKRPGAAAAAAAAAGSGGSSNVAYPLRPRPPAVGVRPFSILAAWRRAAGHIRCVVTALNDCSSGTAAPSSSPASQWVADTWLLTLAETPQQQQQQVALQLLDCQLLLLSRTPPAIASAAAAAGAAGAPEQLLLVGEPALQEDELPPGYLATHPSAASTAAAPSRPSAGAAPAAGSNAAPSGCAAGAGGHDDDDMDDVDPRTLAQAVARLAQFTSAETLGDLPRQQWTDVFRETGPEELAGSAGEAAADVMLFSTSSGSDSSSDSGAGAAPQFKLSASVCCGAHRLLAAQALNSASGSPGQAAGVLLGLADDVDCAVVSAALPTSQAQPGGTANGTASPAAGAAAASGGSGSEAAAAVTLRHEASLPALAYVVAGKTQRRHLLLGGRCGPVCAALVEGARFAYLYGRVAPAAAFGQQQIVDMELPPGSSILGARLVEGSSSSYAGSSDGGDSGSSGNSGALAWLLLLTQQQLICYQLKAPVQS